jgi:hypothetical protein
LFDIFGSKKAEVKGNVEIYDPTKDQAKAVIPTKSETVKETVKETAR